MNNSILYMSVHSSKGLQAKNIILLNVVKGLYGFPSELEDQRIFEPVRLEKINNKEAEENY